jgi:hypothetical protein
MCHENYAGMADREMELPRHRHREGWVSVCARWPAAWERSAINDYHKSREAAHGRMPAPGRVGNRALFVVVLEGQAVGSPRSLRVGWSRTVQFRI